MHTSWDQILVWLISIVSLAVYLGIRFWYLLTGRTARLGQESVSITYSWVVLAAETLMGVLGFYLHQNFWRQDVEFNNISSKTLDKITHVSSMCDHLVHVLSLHCLRLVCLNV